MMKIETKEQAFQLYELGVFGNKLRTWNNLQDIKEYIGTVTMRYASKYGKWCAYEVSQNDIPNIILQWVAEGADESLIRFNESAPDDHLILQGEVMREDGIMILNYSMEKIKMREAMKNPTALIGPEVLNLLRKHMTRLSFNNLESLLYQFRNAVIEFSVYDHNIGIIPYHNTIFWEVRHY